MRERTVDIPLAAPLHAYLRQHALTQPDKPAFLWYGAALSYAQLDAASDAFAARLLASGVQAGEAVALFLGNCPQYVVAHVGIQKAGAIVCPCGPLNKAHELQYQLDDLQARVIVAAAPLLPIVAQVRAQTALQQAFVVHYADLLPEQPTLDLPAELQALRQAPREMPAIDGLACEDFLAVMRSGAPCPPVRVGLSHTALMTYTSGTTGLPKGAMLSHDNALYKTAACAGCNGVAGDDVLLAIAPLYHIAGMLMGIDVTLYTGATTVLLHRFDPLATLQAIERHRVSWWYSIAPMNVACMQVPGAQAMDLSSLRVNPVTSFGITFTAPLAAQWRAHAPRCDSFEAAYGLSETHTCDTYMPREAVRWGTHGKPAPGVTIRILDPDTGADKPTGEVGEIVLKSRGSFQGYWNKPEATAKTLRDGWVHTGDMGVLDDQGYLTFIGRFKEMIKVSGYSVFPEEVETILIKHPAVAQAAVIGVADADKGEVVRAFIVKKPGADVAEAALIAWARDNMASYKAPRSVRFIDALPATGAGKVLRRLLKDPA
ncbi:AMP-binding protein [Aquabacterium sp. OR-4]|uniref:AMP-binding protein n=1 Tax=Aquabacterium sp. OR-4 TaxID=2978127 RepID=UPI0021B20239|nr:AMP-binding protein [Aquabacterium sp. OR-4]MDT7837387.1 AMP-binding protein [Aquabacterium sp. OR-4]